MNKKVSFSQSLQAPAYLTKVKKEISAKGAKPSQRDAVQETRHEKINFKQYLRDLMEDESSETDEFADVRMMDLACTTKRDVRDDEDQLIESFRTVHFGGAYETELSLNESDWDQVASLGRDECITISNEYNERWYITRSTSNHLIIESEDQTYEVKFDFKSFLKRLA
jgi:hypothetical protein